MSLIDTRSFSNQINDLIFRCRSEVAEKLVGALQSANISTRFVIPKDSRLTVIASFPAGELPDFHLSIYADWPSDSEMGAGDTLARGLHVRARLTGKCRTREWTMGKQGLNYAKIVRRVQAELRRRKARRTAIAKELRRRDSHADALARIKQSLGWSKDSAQWQNKAWADVVVNPDGSYNFRCGTISTKLIRSLMQAYLDARGS